ncbi:T9SS type A sorting domain-containing protein [Dyadobacter sp. CY261]|uniref:T9SS type A sorting domain-containing protein n=1 Tax=Dyadobacter sp. CY261 TaxID=2907203 RepID=UPI001F468B72|nr:T9SS type A sorting domain-containing protein [Dyadobacter sp. CY261]MCF0074893.1 T9SS type A sorting domain-containing protein [Dyadobacter sp. CY261]
MKTYLLTIAMAGMSLVVYAQSIAPQVINSGGGQGNAGTVYLDWSIGEMTSVETATSPATILSQGVLQPNDFASLPVKLIYFSGKATAAHNELKWATSEEISNDHFDVERSPDGLRFNLLVRMPGAGNSSIGKTYSFDDREPLPHSYYRLKQVDYDGTFSYSMIIFLKSQDVAASYQLFPNPVSQTLILSGVKKPVDILITNKLGGVILQRKAGADETVRFDLREVPSGTYILTIRGSSQQLNWSSVFIKH